MIFTDSLYGYVLSHFSHVWFCATLWTVARQAPLSMGFLRQKYLSGLPCPPSGDLPHPGIEPRSLALQAHSLPTEPPRMEPESLRSFTLTSGFFTTRTTKKACWKFNLRQSLCLVLCLRYFFSLKIILWGGLYYSLLTSWRNWNFPKIGL